MSRTVYLIHLDRPLAHARHYLGSTDDLERRLHEHEQGNGSKMLAAVARAGISWRLARIKVGRNFYQATARGNGGFTSIRTRAGCAQSVALARMSGCRNLSSQRQP